MNFLDALTRTYCDSPCQVLPNALWKTRSVLGSATPSFDLDPATGVVTHLELSDERHLYLYWDRDRTRLAIPHERREALDLLLLHQDYAAMVAGTFSRRVSYFRLLARGLPAEPAPLPDGFSFRPVDPAAESQGVAELINACYVGAHLTAAGVRDWTNTPVYNPTGWTWVIDEASGMPAGLGIADVDGTIGEGSLEWIQILPPYRGRGLGAALVQQLMRQLQHKTCFITVSGECANPTNPEGLYRRCGFTGEDVWWLLRR